MGVSGVTDSVGVKSFNELKEEGNKAFKNNDWKEALKLYCAALSLSADFSQERAIILKNRAAVYLKLNENQKAIEDCDKALEIIPEDPKALFRRCQALENVGRYEEAFRDAKQIHTVDPTNKAIQPILARLHTIVENRIKENTQTENKIRQMFKYAFNIEEDPEKRAKAVSNFIVLCKESRGSKALIEAGIPWFLDMLNCKEEEQVNAAQYCIQVIINSISGIDKSKDEKPDPKLLEENKAEIDTLLTCLIYGCTSRTISGLARDALIELISRNVHYKAIAWAEQLVKIKGLQRLMEVGSELPEYKYESSMEITDSTRTLTSLCLARIYENMYYDEARTRYLDNIDDYVKDKLLTPELENRIRVVVAITTLLLGPLDVGNIIVSREGIIPMIVQMANSDDVLQQRVACECIIAAATKKDKVKSLISCSVDILKKLYHSKDDGIRVRALVGLCKLGSSGGTDASIRPFADGATTRLAEACKKFLLNKAKDNDMKRWATEGLSYLTLDADVKDKLINDKAALRALFDLAKTGNQAVVYDVITTFVNLVNAYDKQEIIPELVELAKFAKHHVPEDHELDDPEFVAQRSTILVHEGIVSALVALSKAESENSRELIARVFNVLASQQELRGIMVQQGAVKCLLKLTHNGTEKGMRQAAQALARLGVSIDPSVAFNGQKSMEVIKPLLALLRPDCQALENFEALLTLCNLASMNETVRNHIIKEGGLSNIENMMFEQHEMIRRAATQVMTNMVSSPKVVELYEGNNDKTKFLFLLCGEEDEETMKAATGAMAILTSASKICCQKIFEVSTWLDIFHMILAHPNKDIQHRAMVIVYNIISSKKELAEKIIETDIMEILMAYTMLNDIEKSEVKKIAQEALDAAKKWKIIKSADEATNEDEDEN
ncbi:hypothetical protein O3M35_010058 [Rhynocoris fuscipes]|uniref:Protein unc-45 homolog B n=1 Tax=Rhynocoris fuscipes TaxID=488301 RepID=A0AAW1D0Q5_9HEMI